MLEGVAKAPHSRAKPPTLRHSETQARLARAKRPELKCQTPELKTPDSSHAKDQTPRHSDTQAAGQRAEAKDRRAKPYAP